MILVVYSRCGLSEYLFVECRVCMGPGGGERREGLGVLEKRLNTEAAEIFRNCAEILRHQKANPFRVNAYIRAANVLESLDIDVRRLLEQEGTSRLSQLDRLRGEASPEALFQSLPGVGPKLARDIHDRLHVDTLEELELAAYEGLLTTVPGVGERRAAAIRAGLTAALGLGKRARRRQLPAPPVDLLLAIDANYRKQAAAGELPKITPRRFNPEAKAWLPILHADRDGWHFTALFSNTARAHELDRTRDWVVIYFYDDDHQEGQCTVVTETHGPMMGERVVRGRESECRRARRLQSDQASIHDAPSLPASGILRCSGYREALRSATPRIRLLRPAATAVVREFLL
jgi:putative hydrolase